MDTEQVGSPSQDSKIEDRGHVGDDKPFGTVEHMSFAHSPTPEHDDDKEAAAFAHALESMPRQDTNDPEANVGPEAEPTDAQGSYSFERPDGTPKVYKQLTKKIWQWNKEDVDAFLTKIHLKGLLELPGKLLKMFGNWWNDVPKPPVTPQTRTPQAV